MCQCCRRAARLTVFSAAFSDQSVGRFILSLDVCLPPAVPPFPSAGQVLFGKQCLMEDDFPSVDASAEKMVHDSLSTIQRLQFYNAVKFRVRLWDHWAFAGLPLSNASQPHLGQQTTEVATPRVCRDAQHWRWQPLNFVPWPPPPPPPLPPHPARGAH